MSSRQRNLLEAFKHAGEALPAGSPSAGGPFAGPRKVPEDDSPPPPPIPDVDTEVPKATWAEVLDELPAWLPWAVAISVSFFLGLMIGRSSASSPVEAGNENARGESDSNTELVAGDGPVRILPEDIEFEDSRALYDPKNVYTVVLITYESGEAGEGAAWATFDWLTDLGYPVFRPNYSVKSDGSLIVLLAGAKSRRADLDELLVRIKRQKSKNGKNLPFASAYIDEIEDHLNLWREADE